MSENEVKTQVEPILEDDVEVINTVEPVKEDEAEVIDLVHTANTMSTFGQDTSSICEDEKSLDEQVSEIFDVRFIKPSPLPLPEKFFRIRTYVQKLNEEFITSIYDTDQRHTAEINRLSAKIDAQEEQNEVLQCKLKTLMAQEHKNGVLVQKASEKIKKLEATEENHKAYVKMAGDRISSMESKEKQKMQVANNKVKMLETREEKVLALAKKAAIKIKDLESSKRKQQSNAKVAVESIQTLKQMVLAKEEDVQAVTEKAVVEYDQLAQKFEKLANQRAELQTELAEAKKQYKKEHELRKADQKKISSLRQMIEQYDGGVEATWSDLSQAMSEDEDSTNPLVIYNNSSLITLEEFKTAKAMILAKIPDETKMHYGQIGFFNTNDCHFPVLALGPFDVPAGPLREKWLEQANSSLGIYYYGQEDVSMAYDMIPAQSFIPYADGSDCNFHVLPTAISKKNEAGEELSPIEQIVQKGIEGINAAVDISSKDRGHPLKGFEEQFGVLPVESIVVEELRVKLKQTISATPRGEDLREELSRIKDKELLEISTKSKKAPEKQKPVLSVDVQCDNQSCASGTSIDTASCAETMSSLEEQMQSFMHELAVNKKTIRAPQTLPTCPEETRDDVPDSRPMGSLVQQRLKMFNTTNAHASIVIPESSTKDVMKIWQKKVAGKAKSTSPPSTPKQKNTAPDVKTFNFGEDKESETPEIEVADETKGVQTPSTTRCVIIPKNILLKIEAGDPLTETEREILQGIQKFNQNTQTPSEDGSVDQSSTMSNVTIEGGSTDGKQHFEMSAE